MVLGQQLSTLYSVGVDRRARLRSSPSVPVRYSNAGADFWSGLVGQYADIVAARARMWVNEPDDGSSHGADLSVPQTPEDRQRDLESFRSTIKDKLIKLKELTPAMRKEGRVPMADRMWFL